MAEVIGEMPQVGREVGCQGCGAHIRYFKNDVRSYSVRDYGGGSGTYYEITCPRCKKDISAKAWY